MIKCCNYDWNDEVLRCLVCDKKLREPTQRSIPKPTRIQVESGVIVD